MCVCVLWFTCGWCSGQSPPTAQTHRLPFDSRLSDWTFSLFSHPSSLLSPPISLLSPSTSSHPPHPHQFQVTWTLSTLTEWTLFWLLGDITRLQLVTRPSLSLRHEWMNRCCLVTDPFLSLKGTVQWRVPHGASLFLSLTSFMSMSLHWQKYFFFTFTVDEEEELGHMLMLMSDQLYRLNLHHQYHHEAGRAWPLLDMQHHYTLTTVTWLKQFAASDQSNSRIDTMSICLSE